LDLEFERKDLELLVDDPDADQYDVEDAYDRLAEIADELYWISEKEEEDSRRKEEMLADQERILEEQRFAIEEAL